MKLLNKASIEPACSLKRYSHFSRKCTDLRGTDLVQIFRSSRRLLVRSPGCLVVRQPLSLLSPEIFQWVCKWVQRSLKHLKALKCNPHALTERLCVRGAEASQTLCGEQKHHKHSAASLSERELNRRAAWLLPLLAWGVGGRLVATPGC